jgi:hypothetical protein
MARTHAAIYIAIVLFMFISSLSTTHGKSSCSIFFIWDPCEYIATGVWHFRHLVTAVIDRRQVRRCIYFSSRFHLSIRDILSAWIRKVLCGDSYPTLINMPCLKPLRALLHSMIWCCYRRLWVNGYLSVSTQWFSANQWSSIQRSDVLPKPRTM